ncbi:MBL fold metallo-hydrolase [Pendulispora brunnea]|uniref:MBL fold metallo-hydrolase n=1 Tax=Pendulispora brunnea TaxID=2905690 RepID=A0ABZ2KAX1_9BACT
MVALACIALTHCAAFGARPTGERLARAMRSPQWHHGRFENPQASWTDLTASYLRLFARSEPDTQPSVPLETVSPAFDTPPASGLAVTWFGHSSALLEIDGVNVLVDPLWSARASPIGWLGPSRWFIPPAKLDALPVDAVVISHDHYDHLDYGSILTLKGTRARFVVPLGVGAHLEHWGIPRERITELDWWESTRIGGLDVVATPARHASGRGLSKSNRTLWAGFAFIGSKHRAWYSGDTGFHDDLARIGERFGPFDVTLIESGQYDANWPDAHLGPELAVEAHRRVRGTALLPVHWGALQLAPHPWTEPIERVLVAAACHDVEVLALRPGERVEPTEHPPLERWWPNAAWRPASKAPVLGTKNGNAAERIALPPCTRSG